MKVNIYRVEVNHGSKMFETGLEAFLYFQKMKAKQFKAELWLVTRRRINKRLVVTQELIAH